jgi:NADP-dependent aldehyde dehydrogenase
MNEVERACQAALEAIDLRRHLGRESWADVLDKIATALDAQRDEVLAVSSEETALTVEELSPEFARMTGTLRMFAALVREGSWVRAAVNKHRENPAESIGPNHDVRSMLLPLGPVAVFGASNFPLAYGVCGGDTASALAAGCPVVVKEHPAHPRTGRLIFEIACKGIAKSEIQRFTQPSSVLNYVRNENPQDLSVATDLVQQLEIRAVGFTGSRRGGMALVQLANEREDYPVPVFAEMGSANPAYVTLGAAARRPVEIADQLADSILARFGQQCTKPGLIFVRDIDSSGPLAQRLAERFRAAQGRDMLAPWIADAYRRRVQECIDTRSAEVVARGGDRPGPRGATPMLLRTYWDDWFQHETLQEEVFGPAAILVGCGQAEEENGFFGATFQGHLACSWFAEPNESALVQRALRSHKEMFPGPGRIAFNSVPTGVRVAHAMVHGGPFPSTNRPDTTAVGPFAIERWCRPVCFQNCPNELLPPELQDGNPLNIWRYVDGLLSRE